MMEQEHTFFTLLTDLAHWEFELFLIVLFDMILGMVIWPFFRSSILHHKSDDEKIKELEERINKLEV